MIISEVSKKLGITVRAIRHYEELGLIKSARADNNYRTYNKDTFDKIKFLARGRRLGFSINECRILLHLFNNKNRSSSEVRSIAEEKIIKLASQIKELQDLKDSLVWLTNKCPDDNKPNCPILDELAN